MENSLYIIDGHAQIYRAYYAVMGLTSPTGEPTNATFGFAAMLLKLFQTRKPTHVVMAMDAGAAARIAMDANYKAQRKPMPEDMPQQIERITQIMQILEVPIFKAEGCEADDVIATLVRAIRKDPAHAETMLYLCTKDKDMDQLIDEKVHLFDIQAAEDIDRDALFAKKGYWPEQAGDVLALTGDNVDNIPGIPGVGPKTAAKWIAEFGSLDNLIANKDALKGKIGETFRANLHVLEHSRKMVGLHYDLPVQMDWAAARLQPEKLPALADVFRELGFTRLLGTLDELVAAYRGARPPAAAPKPQPAPPSGLPRRGLRNSKQADGPTLFDQSAESSDEMAIADDAPEGTESVEPSDEPQAGFNFSALQPSGGDYRLINTPQLLDEMITQLQADLAASSHHWLAVDTETDALGSIASNLCGISLCAKEKLAYYVAVKGPGDCLPITIVKDKLGPMLADPAIKKVGQNLKYDINALRCAGLPFAGTFLDTMVASYVLDSSRLTHKMDALAADFLGVQTIPITDLIGKGKTQTSFDNVPLDRAATYSGEDADITLRLAHLLYDKLIASGMEKLCLELEMPLVDVLAGMEYEGILIDTSVLSGMSKMLDDRLADLRTRIRDAAGRDFNFDSPKQLAKVLFEDLQLKVIKKTRTGPSTDITVLEQLADLHPVPALIVEYRQLTKLKNTYVDALTQQVNKRTGRVHTSFNQTIAATGRLSSSDPNLQNIPIKTDIGREIRRAFVAAPGHVLITADYSQIELRVLAHYCGEPALLDAFANNRDVHRVVAAEIYKVPEEEVKPEMRAIAKTVNFGIIYGQTGFGLAQVLKIPQSQANDFINAYRKKFPKIEEFTHTCVRNATMQGYVTTILGRRRAIPDIQSPNQARRQFGQRAALNSVIQGSAADLIKLAMIHVQRRIERENHPSKLLLQIHDELVLECPAEIAEQEAAMVRQEMEGAMKLNVPVRVDIGWSKNWLDE
jgi:DNA polymerase I